MINTILGSIRKSRCGSSEDTGFDSELLLYINTAMSTLYQLGIKTANMIVDETTCWDKLLGDRTDMEMVKTYIDFKVKVMFDPPTNSAVAEAIGQTIKDLEWRINNIDIINKEIEEVTKDG